MSVSFDSGPSLDLDIAPVYNEQLTSLDRFLDQSPLKPGHYLTFDAPNRDDGFVVVHDPLSKIPLTEAMTQAVGLDRPALQAMVDQRAPLGISEDHWNAVTGELFRQFELSHIPLEGLTVKLGGSAAHGFSSSRSALANDSFPRTAVQLTQIIKDHAPKGTHRAELQKEIDHRVEIFEQATTGLALGPKSPWWGMPHRLGLGQTPDIDIQIHSPALDDRMQAEIHGPGRRVDKNVRWAPSTVNTVLPFVPAFYMHIKRLSAPVSLTFLANEGGQREIAGRTDWWTITPKG